MDAAKSKEVADEYISSLADLSVNSKPMISMLTILAEESTKHAPAIVQAVEAHLQKVTYLLKLQPKKKTFILHLIFFPMPM